MSGNGPDTRGEKSHRAQQLGIPYPIVSEQQIVDETITNILFVCSMNRWRSPTAESIYRTHPRLSVRSAGTSQNSKHQVNANDITWADLILVMEDKHKKRLLADFPGEMKYKKVVVLDIPDEYKYMDPELVEAIRGAVDTIVFRKKPSADQLGK